MATFEAQIEAITSLALTGSSTPTQDELSQFLKDGVMDVTSRWLTGHPGDVYMFGRESAETTSNDSLNLNGARIISVVREDGTNNQWRGCTQISPSMQYEVTDTDSLNYASKTNPVFMIGDAGKISVFPAPGSDPNAFKVYYVNKDAVNGSGSSLAYSHDDILYFPIDKVYLVVLYASIKTLTAAMTGISNDLASFSITSVPPDTATAYEDPDVDDAAGRSISDEINDMLAYIETSEDVELANAKGSEITLRFRRALDQFQSGLGKYNAEIQAYAQEVAAEVSEQGQKVQTETAKYQWYQERVTGLQQEYMSAFLIPKSE